MPIAIGTMLIFSLFTNNVQTAGPIGMGEALIDVFPPREDKRYRDFKFQLKFGFVKSFTTTDPGL